MTVGPDFLRVWFDSQVTSVLLIILFISGIMRTEVPVQSVICLVTPAVDQDETSARLALMVGGSQLASAIHSVPKVSAITTSELSNPTRPPFLAHNISDLM